MRIPIDEYNLEYGAPSTTAFYPVEGVTEWTPHEFIICEHCGEAWGYEGGSKQACEEGLCDDGWNVDIDLCPTCHAEEVQFENGD